MTISFSPHLPRFYRGIGDFYRGIHAVFELFFRGEKYLWRIWVVSGITPPMVVMLGAASLSPLAPASLASAGGAVAAGVAAVAPGIAAPFSPPWAAAAGQATDPFAPVAVEYVSPSAIETATEELGGCLRKWAWSKLDRVPKTSGKAAELGSAMHAQHELYLEHGTPYDLTTRAGELAIATLHLLPAPGVAIVEQEFRVQVAALGPDAWLGGKVDANWAEDPHAAGAVWTHADMAASHGGAILPRRPGRRQIILDHKSTGDIRWAKLTRDELLHHPQAPIYTSFWWSSGRREVRVKNSKEWRAWDPGFVPNDIELRWNYVTTKGKPKAEPSWHVVEPDEVWAAFTQYVAPGAKRLLQVVQEANETRASGKPFGAMQLPANPSACGAFGGCQFRDRCGVSPLEGVRAMADQSLAFLTKMGLAAAPGGQPVGLPAAVVPVEAAPAAPAQVAAPAPVSAAPAPWMPPAAAQVAPVVAPVVHAAPFVAPVAAAPAQGYGAQINPPESALPVAAPVVVAPVVVATPVTTLPSVDALCAPAVPAAPTTEAPKKGPGRPRKNQTTPEPLRVLSVDPCEAEAPVDVTTPVVFHEPFSLHDRALIAVLPAAFEACKAAIFAGTAAPSSALELARAVVAPLQEAK